MNCPNCAAAMQAVGGQAYFRCEYCGTLEFPQSTEEGIATLGDTTDFACPVCRDPLQRAMVEGYSVCYCGKCRGFLSSNADFSQILLRRRAVNGDRPPMPRTIEKSELRRRTACPKCANRMETHPYGGGGNVVLDTCDRCRLVWLDSGEMDALARHRPANGSSSRLAPGPSSSDGGSWWLPDLLFWPGDQPAGVGMLDLFADMT